MDFFATLSTSLNESPKTLSCCLGSEAEIIEFASRLFDSLNLQNIEIQINHRKLVESFIRNNYPYFDPKQQDKVFGDSFRLVDKVAKKSKEQLLKEP